jgi:hypothetical protein
MSKIEDSDLVRQVEGSSLRPGLGTLILQEMQINGQFSNIIQIDCNIPSSMRAPLFRAITQRRVVFFDFLNFKDGTDIFFSVT